MSTDQGPSSDAGATLSGPGLAPATVRGPAPAVLVVERDEGGAETATYELERERYVVGRHERCDVRIRDRDLSREHAALERDAGGRWWVVDLDGASGTFVNGRRLEGSRRHRLGPADVVHVGTWRLRVRAGVVGEAVAAGPALLLPPDGERARPDPARIRIYDGAFADRELRLDRGEVVIGAGEGATVPLEPGRYAGVRVVIRPRKDGGFDVRDESEAPSLSVNGRQLAGHALGAGDVVLRIGAMEVQQRNAHDAFTVRYMPGRRRPGQETPAADASQLEGAPPPAAEPHDSRRATRPMRALSAGEGSPAPVPWAHDTAPLRGPVGHDTAPFPALPAPAWLAEGDTLPGAPPVGETEGSAPADPGEAKEPAVDVDAEQEPATTASARAQPQQASHDTERFAALPFDPPPEEGPPPAEPHAPPQEANARTDRAESIDPPTSRTTRDGAAGRQAAPHDGPTPRAEGAARRGRPMALTAGLAVALVGIVAAFLAWRRPAHGPPPAASSALAALSTSAPAAPAGVAGGATSSPTSPPRPPEAPSARLPQLPAPSAAPRTPAPSRPPQRTPAAPANGQDGPKERDASEDAQEALRRRLETKAKAGKATTGELRTLLNLCAQEHDAACLAQTKAQMAAKEAP